jgi:hypothetical protein
MAQRYEQNEESKSDRMRLARELGVGSGEQGKKERGTWIVVRNPEIHKFHQK